MRGLRLRSALVVAVLMVVGCLLAGHTAPSALADPMNPGAETQPADPVPPIAWSALGRSDRMEILGSDQAVDADIPVPQGVTPGLLTGEIGSVVNTVDGRVDVLDRRGVVLGSIGAPPDATSASFAVDISGAQVIDGVATLSFVLREHNPPTDSCTRPPSVTLGQLASSYFGQTPYPVRVADFEPGYVDEFVIRTGPFPTAAQQQAALELVAKLTRSYRPMPVRVVIDPSPDAVPPGPSARRVIELREANSPGLMVQNPDSPDAVLVISGRGSELSRQVQLFADRRIELAQAPAAIVKSATVDVPKAATVLTFGQLRISGDISVLGAATLYIGIDAGQFGVGPIQQANLHLIAHYTPVVSGEGSVVVRSGDTVLATRKLDDSGLLDISGLIPPEAIQSNVGVALQLRYLPSQRCAPLNDRMQFTLDPSSSVSVTPGTYNRGGFPVLPMAFAPAFDVAIDDPDHLRFAGEAINLLAQQTTMTLQPRITSLPEAARSGSGALIVASGEDLARVGLEPPVVSEGADSVDISGSPATDVDLNGPTGVVQAFSDHGRTVLAIDATGDWSLVDRCFDYIRSLPSRWESLTGDVVATGAAGRSVNLTLREGGALVNRDPGGGWRWWAWATAASVAAALLTTAGVLLWRRRVRRANPAR